MQLKKNRENINTVLCYKIFLTNLEERPAKQKNILMLLQ